MLTRAKLLERRKQLEAAQHQALSDANAAHGAIQQIDWELAEMDKEESGKEVHGSDAEKAG